MFSKRSSEKPQNLPETGEESQCRGINPDFRDDEKRTKISVPREQFSGGFISLQTCPGQTCHTAIIYFWSHCGYKILLSD